MTETPDRHDDESVSPPVDPTSWTPDPETSDPRLDVETGSDSEFTTADPSTPVRSTAALATPGPSTPESRFSQLAARVAAAKAAPRRADLPSPEPHRHASNPPTTPPSADAALQPEESVTTTEQPEPVVSEPVVSEPASDGAGSDGAGSDADPGSGVDPAEGGASGGVSAVETADPAVLGADAAAAGPTAAGVGGVGPGAGAPGGGAAGVQPELDELADPERLRAAVEAVLLVIDTPTSAVTFAQVLGRSVPDIRAALRTLQADYNDGGRGIDLREVADGWRLYSRDEFAGYVERFVLDGQQARLTQAALETLSVIAYRQPVTRSRISGIRGVSVDAVMRTLLTRGLVEECGADPDTGGGLYRTTRLFLEKLGLRSLDELPSLAPLLPDTSQLDDVELST